MIHDPNIKAIEEAAAVLEPFINDVVLVGGCAVGLLITDPASPVVRTTIDVDMIIEIAPLTEYYAFCEKLKSRGLVEQLSDTVICRWSKGPLVIDIMPADPKVLGFSNTWYPAAIRSAITHSLPSGRIIQLINAPLFLATKLESFRARGNGDYLHHDIEDIVNLLNGRATLNAEVVEADDEVKAFLMDEFDALLADASFVESFAWHLHPTDHELRREIVLRRIRGIAGF